MAVKQLGKKNTEFSPEKFNNPGGKYGSVYNWSWSCPLSKEQTDKCLEKFAELGITGLAVIPMPKEFRPTQQPTFLEPGYLTDAFLEAYKYAFEKAFSLGITTWFYDEGGWPSGMGCGKVLLAHPEDAKYVLRCDDVEYKKGDVYAKPEKVMATFIGADEIKDGYVFKEDTTVGEYYRLRAFCLGAGHPDLPDTTYRKSAEDYIETVHEPHKKYLGEYFGTKVTAVFTDEPAGPAIPFREEFVAEFERRLGKSIVPYLPYIAGKVPQTEESAKVRIMWYDMCSEYFCKNFLLVEKEWTNNNNMSYAGHLNGDDRPMINPAFAGYHVMRGLRCFDVPGVDAIWRQIFPAKEKQDIDGFNVEADNKFFPRYASSAMTQVGSDACLSESFGVYGNGLSFEEMRYVYAFQAIRGINIYNPMALAYPGDSALMIPRFGPMSENYACSFADMKPFNKYVERLGYISSLGDPNNKIALYFPMCDSWASYDVQPVIEAYDKTGWDMEQSGLSFDIFDDEFIATCDREELRKGRAVMNKACYTSLVISPNKFMPEKTKENLETFIKGGGKVFVVEGKYTPEIKGATLVKDCKNILPPILDFACDKTDFRVLERIADNCKVVMIYNESADTRQAVINVGNETPLLLDVTEGKIKSLNKKDGKISFSMFSGELFALLYTNENYATDDQSFANEQILDGEYQFKKTRRYKIYEMSRDSFDLEEEYQKGELGDWCEVTGSDFSGSCKYKTIFNKPATDGDVVLDLGKVRVSCEAFVNGESVGVRVMSPYRFNIPAKLLKEKNVLEVRVSNTVANERVHTKTFDKWANWQRSPYELKIAKFDKSSLPSGLFGPVKILY